MNDYTIQRCDLCMSDPAPFAQHWEARVATNLTELDVGVALQPCITSLRSGDLVNVTAYTRPDWRVLTAVASYRVVSVARTVKVVQVGEVIEVPEEVINLSEQSVVRLHWVQVGSSYVVRDEKDNELEAFSDQEQAENFIRREQGRVRPTDPSAKSPPATEKRGQGGRFKKRAA